MYNTYELVKIGKERNGIKSDYEFGMRFGLSRMHINNWKMKGGRPNIDNLKVLADAAGLSMDAAYAVVMVEQRQAGFANVGAMLMAAFFALVTLFVTPTPSEAAPMLKQNGERLYIMLNRRRSYVRFRSWAFALFTTPFHTLAGAAQRRTRSAAWLPCSGC